MYLLKDEHENYSSGGGGTKFGGAATKPEDDGLEAAYNSEIER